METRLNRLRQQFCALYGASAELVVRSPGRAEIIGNHTDYNLGYSLAAAISRSTLALYRARSDDKFRLVSNSFKTPAPLEFVVAGTIDRDPQNDWTKYPRGVIQTLVRSGLELQGADLLIDSTVPASGGVSSSAALELATAVGMLALADAEMDALRLAKLCQQAENEYVGSPCGFLDQGAVALGREGHLLFLDFKPSRNFPVSRTELIPADLSSHGLSFVIAVDGGIKRQLGSSGYPARRKMCEDSCLLFSKLLQRKVSSLREISVAEFETQRQALDHHNPVMRKRVEHVVYENQRVLDSVAALRKGRMEEFGALLSASGLSAIKLYELDEQTPELTCLLEEGRSLPGVLGLRNMGGGFSAVVLGLVKAAALPEFKERLTAAYCNRFTGALDFIEFAATDGAAVIA